MDSRIAFSAKFLRARKQDPTQQWLKELPHKARKLEQHLYKTAPSLEAYLDKATLKSRLKKVARAISSGKFRMTNNIQRKPSPRTTSLASSDQVTFRSPVSTIASPGSFRNPTSSTAMDPFRNASTISDLASSFAASIVDNAPIRSSDALMEQQVENQRLQQQILDNIRQQQQLMRELMQTSKTTAFQQQLQQLQRQQQQVHRKPPMPVMLNIVNPPGKANMLVHSLLLGDKMGNYGHHQQLGGGLSNAASLLNLTSTTRSLPSSGFHPNMPPPSRQSFQDDNVSLSPNSFQW